MKFQMMIASVVAAGLFATTFDARAGDADRSVKGQRYGSARSTDAYASARGYDSWAGLYAGINIGYGIGQANLADSATFNCVFCGPPFNAAFTQPANLNMNGFVGGIQIGYNWRLSPSMLFGLEEDLQWTNQKASVTHNLNISPVVTANFGMSNNVKLAWFGTTRARIGFFSNPNTLWYVTGGAAYGQTTLTTSTSFISPGDSLIAATKFQANKLGFVAGGGVETAVGQGVTAKIEYLYMDLGTVGGNFLFVGRCVAPATCLTAAGTARAAITDHILRAGLNFHF
jgi:outer membrane immunogenic protein